jgi:uncharacterized protein YprB with RNaseH-like and TPR domain
MTLSMHQFLTMCESLGQLAFYDIESSNLSADFGCVVCVAIKPFGKRARVFVVRTVGKDAKIVNDVLRALEQFTIIAGFYSDRFDRPFLNTRAVINKLRPLSTNIKHLDLWRVAKSTMKVSRRNQGHLLRVLKASQSKMNVDPHVWSELPTVNRGSKRHLRTLIKRCKSDVESLEQLYRRMRPLIK